MRIYAALAGLFALAGSAMAGSLTVEVAGSRSQADIDSQIDAAARAFGKRAALLTQRARLAQGNRRQFSLPIRVVLTKNGKPLPMERSRAADLTLSFDASGARSFPAAYRTRLQDTFAAARPAMNALFGTPKTGGTVRVLNYDADIQDRLAVAGGVYVANAPGGPQIRLPVYNSPVSASINAIHCFLLAYAGDAALPTDAWSEGLARGAAIMVARTPGAVPGSPAPEEIEATLDSLYDASPTYDWLNQPGVGAQPFIAPNLLNATLPLGGSVGGPYLLRYQLAGTAFAKILVEHPGFAAEFNRRFYATPALFSTEAGLFDQAQQALNAVAGSSAATVEGLSFASWARRQFILDSTRNPGLRLVLQPFSLPPEAGSQDFGPFGIVAHATRILASGDELLLAGRSYPVYWRPDNQRFFTSIQDDIMDFAGAYGSVAPNFPRGQFDGSQYRVVVDLPLLGRTARTILPAGSIATGQNPSPTQVYGTLSGFPPLAAGFYVVRAEWPGGSEQAQAVNGAFGIRIADAAFLRAQTVTIKVLEPSGASLVETLVRRVNKTTGPLAVSLLSADSERTATLNLPGGLGAIGLPLAPYRPDLASVLGGDTLAADWQPRTGRWLLAPDFGFAAKSQGLFVRSAAAGARAIEGRWVPRMPEITALDPGWNLISPPSFAPVSVSGLAAASAAEALSTYQQAVGTILGPTIFAFVRDPVNPDLGAYQPATTLAQGQAYWVKCLRAEGGFLAFNAGGAAAPSRAPSGPPFNPAWELQFKATSSTGLDSWVQIGQAQGASRAIDPRIDSELPPSIGGGIQVSVAGPRPLFRDIRSLDPSEVWRVRVTGLQPGKTTSLSLNFTRGRTGLLLLDKTSGMRWNVGRFLFTTFRARAATHEFVIGGAGAQ